MKWLTTSLLVFICINLFAQSELELQLLKLEQKAYAAQNDTLKNTNYLHRFNLLIQTNHKSKLYHEMRRIREKFITDSLKKSNFFWNAALASKIYGDFQYADIYYDAYLDFTNDSSTSSLLLGLLIKADRDTAEYYTLLNSSNDSNLTCTNCLIELIDYQIKNKPLYVWSSKIIPGLGTALTGDIFNGVGSVVTLGGSSIGVAALIINQLYIGAGVWGIMTIPRFYNGQIRLTKTKVNELEKKKRSTAADKCSASIKERLRDFSIDFKVD